MRLYPALISYIYGECNMTYLKNSLYFKTSQISSCIYIQVNRVLKTR